jgi:hypothetical protein
MESYLYRYGEGHEQRSKRKKRIIAGIALAIVAGLSVYSALHNHQQKARVTQFMELLQKHDYAAAYRLWGCTETKPCPDYKFDKFMEDWGPQSKYAQIGSFSIAKSKSCGSGVMITVGMDQGRSERFWVENSDMTIGFSPWQVCPAR